MGSVPPNPYRPSPCLRKLKQTNNHRQAPKQELEDDSSTTCRHKQKQSRGKTIQAKPADTSRSKYEASNKPSVPSHQHLVNTPRIPTLSNGNWRTSPYAGFTGLAVPTREPKAGIPVKWHRRRNSCPADGLSTPTPLGPPADEHRAAFKTKTQG